MQINKVSVGRTYNLGNYESLRIEVTVEREAKDESVDNLYDRAVMELNRLKREST